MKRFLLLPLLIIAALLFSSTALAGSVMGTSVSVVGAPNPSNFGQNVTFTATVQGMGAPPVGDQDAFDGVFAPEGLPPPGGLAGTVTFTDTFGGTTRTIGTATLPAGAGATKSASVSTSTLAPGFHTITATYTGNQPTATGTVVQQVTGTTVSLVSTPNPSDSGQNVSVTATVQVTAPQTGSLSGTIAFSDTFNGQTTNLTTLALPGGGGFTKSTTFTTAGLAAGTHVITAVYTGNAPGGQGQTQHVVRRVNGTTVIVNSNSNPAVVGSAVTFTANVSSPSNTPRNGTLTILDGTVVLGSGPGSTLTVTTSTLSIGTHNIRAVYEGDTSVVDGEGTLTETIRRAATTVTLTSSANPATLPTIPTFSVQVRSTGSNVIPTGNVSFSDGQTVLGAVALTNGTAQFRPSSLRAGTLTITAAYGGDVRTEPSKATLTQTVRNVQTATLTLTANPNPARFGAAVTLRAQITSTLGVPNGVVTFGTGNALLGQGALDAAGVATFVARNLPVGATTITASYDGRGFFPSTSGTVVARVDRGDTAITLTSTPNPSNVGDPVTFTAALTSATAGVSGGEVEVIVDGAVLGVFPANGNTGSFTTTALSAGSHNVTVRYRGNAQFNGSSSASVTQFVNDPQDQDGDGIPDDSTSSGGPNVGPFNYVTVGGDDDGCAVANVGSSSTPRFAAIAAAALAAALVVRRRRRSGR